MSERPLSDVFAGGWPAGSSVSGTGSNDRGSRQVLHALPLMLGIIAPGRAAVVNDAGCGDLAWMRDLAMTADYAGYDTREWPTWPALREEGVRLEVADIVSAPMRAADVVICRDVMIHLPNEMCLSLLRQCMRSAPWLIATTYVSGPAGRVFSNSERLRRPSRSFARLDLRHPPFSLGPPLLMMPEPHEGKFLGAWHHPVTAS